MGRLARPILIWIAVAALVIVPIAVALGSPLLAWRQPVYIVAGAAGVIGLAMLFLQPLLADGALPGLPPRRGRPLHRALGVLLVGAVVIHVSGLWLTSPPDVVDALLFRSPTPFSAWGVIAFWAVLATGVIALWRRRMSPRAWRMAHTGLAVLIVSTTALHAVLIEGTMGQVSKAVLCLCAVGAVLHVAAKVWWRLIRG